MFNIRIKAESINELTSKEIDNIISDINVEDIDCIKNELKNYNEELSKKIEHNKAEIATETGICEILLKKLWRSVRNDRKKQLALFFKNIISEIRDF